MPSIMLTTYQDLKDHAIDFLNAEVSAMAERDARRAVLNAYRELAHEHNWTLYYGQGRINTMAPQTTGTVQYQDSSGVVPRAVTLTGATWPTWAALGKILIANVFYEISNYISSTVIQLSSSSNPGADIAAGATYRLQRDSYPLPADFAAMDELINVNQVLALSFVHPREWLMQQRFLSSPAYPVIFTVKGDTKYMGSLAVSLYPPPDQAYQLDYIYRRRPRQLLLDSSNAGVATVSAGANTISGSGTNWTANMVGSSFRFSADAINLPTGRAGANPAAFERMIVGYTSASALTLDASVPQALAGVKYNISDPADIEEGAMLTALLRGIECQMARSRNMKEKGEIEGAYKRWLEKAKDADSRSFERRQAGEGFRIRPRLAFMPMGPDIGG